MPAVGETIGGKYLLGRELGRGGMGVVFEAKNVATDARVAIKFLGAEAAKSEFIAGRFMCEAKAAGRLRSRYVARIFDADKTAQGEPFIVMELLEGMDLADLIDRGPLPVTRACSLLVQACAGVDEAHRHGIIHRDLKPANLFVASEGNDVMKVLDFGVSKVTTSNEGDPTGSMAVLGTMRYMSPEHFLDARSVDARADVWALGVILFYALEGRVPFIGDGPSLIASVLAPSAMAPPLTRPDVPPPLAEIVARCLVKNRDGRISSVAELAELLAPYAAPSAIADALGEIRARRHAHTPQDGVPAVIDAMGATMAAGGGWSPTVTVPSQGAMAGVVPSGQPRPPTAPTDHLFAARTGPVPPIDATGAPTSRSHATQGIPGVPPKTNPAIFLVVGGLAITIVLLGFVLATRERPRPVVAEPTPPPVVVTQPPPPATTVIIMPAPTPSPTVSVAPTPTAKIKPTAPTPPTPPTHRHDAGAPTIPTLL